MSSRSNNLPLIIDNGNNGHNKQEHDGSEIMLTTFESDKAKTNYDSIREETQILLPGDEKMTRDEVVLYPTYLYVLYYLSMLAIPFLVTYLANELDDVDIEEFISEMVFIAVFGIIFGWFIGAVFYNLCGMPSNYTRKIGHLWAFMGPIMLAGGLDSFDDESGADNPFGTFDQSGAFNNIIFDVLVAAWASQFSILLQTRPTRNCSNYLCGNTRSKNPCRWINCCENTIDAFERKEDRPNHLLWLNTQMVLYFLFLFLLSFWWNELDSGVMILIPVFIGGLGDGLAEPVGVKFGKTGCGTGRDCTFKTHGCCTKYDYTRSIPGSSMVLLSGYLGVFLAYDEYSMWQFVIAMLIVPPIGTIVEAKAPHTMDNPFIAAIVGIVATAILYIPY